MTPHYVTISPDMTAAEALDTFARSAAKKRSTSSTSSTPTANCSKTFASARWCWPIRNKSHRHRRSAAGDHARHRRSRKRAEAFEKYDRVALPVTDADGHMLGIITVDDVLDVAEQEATEDIQKLGGTEALDAPYLQVGFWDMIHKRGGWLSALFLGEMLTATAMGFFEDEIANAVVLALFVPLIICSGGNSGSQATSLIIRSLALRELRLRDWFRVFRREIISGLALGILLGFIGFFRIVLWEHLHLTNYGPHYMLVAFTVWASADRRSDVRHARRPMLPFILAPPRLRSRHQLRALRRHARRRDRPVHLLHRRLADPPRHAVVARISCLRGVSNCSNKYLSSLTRHPFTHSKMSFRTRCLFQADLPAAGR